MFRLFSRPSLPIHVPATFWHVPLDWHNSLIKPHYSVTAFWEDLPEHCYVCGSETSYEDTDPMYIEGKFQYMKRVQFCPKGCGFTVWIA